MSGLVRRLVASDTCVSRVSLKIPDNKHHFNDIVRLMNGDSITITRDNAPFFRACAHELENYELSGRVLHFQMGDGVSLVNVLDRIRIKNENHDDCKPELDFIASHFFEINLGVLKCLSLSEIESILTSPLLQLESEDQLYDAIMSLIREKGEDYVVLLRNIEMAFLSEYKLSAFLDMIFPNLVDASVWASLCQCVRRFSGLSAKLPLMKVERYRGFEEFPCSNGAFNGIIQHLRDECGGNPHKKGVISIDASGTACNQCYKVIDYGWDSWWVSYNDPDSYIQFDFKSRSVCLSDYSLKSDGGVYHLLSWALEVSDDGTTWEIIDERDTQDLNGESVEKTYTCTKSIDKFSRFVRLRQTGKNSGNDNSLRLSAIEFFGKLQKPSLQLGTTA